MNVNCTPSVKAQKSRKLHFEPRLVPISVTILLMFGSQPDSMSSTVWMSHSLLLKSPAQRDPVITKPSSGDACRLVISSAQFLTDTGLHVPAERLSIHLFDTNKSFTSCALGLLCASFWNCSLTRLDPFLKASLSLLLKHRSDLRSAFLTVVLPARFFCLWSFTSCSPPWGRSSISLECQSTGMTNDTSPPPCVIFTSLLYTTWHTGLNVKQMAEPKKWLFD